MYDCSRKQNIYRQVRELKKLDVKRENIYLEYENGTKVERAELKKLLKVVDKNDTIVVTEVSIITRSTRQLIDIMKLAKERNVRLELGNMVLTVQTTARQTIALKQ